MAFALSMPKGIFGSGMLRLPRKHRADLTAGKRYQALVQQLLNEPGATQTSVAKQLGCGQPHISRVLNDARGIGVDAIELAVRNLKIHSVFFFIDLPADSEPPNYLDYAGPRKIPPSGGYAAMADFLENDPLDMKPTTEEREAIERMRWDGEPTLQTYVYFLQALRSVRKESTAVRARRQRDSKR